MPSKLTNNNKYIIHTNGNEKTLVGYIGAETDLIIPEGVTAINKNAFKYCSSLTSIEIPESVTSIGRYAFEHCRSLKTINYSGTKAEWNAISKGSYWNTNVYATVYCSDGTISI